MFCFLNGDCFLFQTGAFLFCCPLEPGTLFFCFLGLTTYASEETAEETWLNWLILLGFLSMPTFVAVFRPPSKRAFDLGNPFQKNFF
jgi:hypothetical protein